MKTPQKLSTGFGFFMLGVMLLIGGGYILTERLAFFNQSTLAEGTIIDIESKDRKSTTYYYPVVSFNALDGKTYTFSSELGSNSSFDYDEGEKIMVRYMEEQPEKAKISSFWNLWSLPMTLLFAGLVITLAGSTIVYKSFQKNKTKQVV
ncbi:DUF3592 domain-containing protein [Roseivirga echinicomitans]